MISSQSILNHLTTDQGGNLCNKERPKESRQKASLKY